MKILINGGGIAGLTCAIALQKLGFETEVFEAAPQIKPAGAGLVIQRNAIKAFEYLGIADDVIRASKPINQFSIRDEKGRIIKNQKPSSSDKMQFVGLGIHRHTLHQILQRHLPEYICTTNKKAVRFTNEQEKIRLHFEDGTDTAGDYLISADGIHSPIRLQLLPDSKPRYAGYICWRSVVNNSELNITSALEFWGPKGRFGIVPINGNNVYWYASINAAHQYDSKNYHYSLGYLKDHFAGYPAEVKKVLALSADDALVLNPISDIKPLDRFAFGRVLLIGDAAHATTPNLGQGACQAIEDVMVLHQELTSVKDISAAFSSFDKRRVKKAAYIINTSRKLGAAGQIENKFLSAVRNLLMKLTPASVTENQFKKIYE